MGTLRGRWGTERGTPQREPGPELRPAGPAPPPRPSSQTAGQRAGGVPWPAPGEGAGGRGEAPAGRTVRALELACWGTGAGSYGWGLGGRRPGPRAQGPAHRLPAVRLQASPLLLSCPLSISQTAETSPGSEPSGECGVSQREPGDLCGLQHALSKRQVLPRSPGRDCPHRALGREDAGCAGVPRVAWGERRSRSFPGPPTWLRSPRPQPLPRPFRKRRQVTFSSVLPHGPLISPLPPSVRFLAG